MLDLADAALVAEHCDGLMLLVNGSRGPLAPQRAVAHSQQRCTLLGLISNMKPKSNGAYGYGYGKYGYGKYGYGYGYG